MFACYNIRTKHCDIYRVEDETEVAGIKVSSVHAKREGLRSLEFRTFF